MKKLKITAAVILTASICAITACNDSKPSDSGFTAEITSDFSAESLTEEAAHTTTSSAQTTIMRSPEDIAVTDEIILPVSDILFSDSFDYDGDGYQEEFTFLNIGTNADGDTMVAVYYSEEDNRPAEFARFEMVTNLLSDGFFAETLNGQRIVGAVTEIAMGAGSPAVCFAVVDGTPQQINEELTFTDSSQPFLVHTRNGIMVRQCGPAAGINNLYPVYWKNGELHIYDTVPVDMDNVREADVNGIVGNIENVTSIFIRTNGLLHINYIPPEGNVNSVTYIIRNNKITALYDPEVHGHLGRYLTAMEVLPSPGNTLVAVPEIGYTQQDIQSLLADFGSFCYAYVDGKAFRQGVCCDVTDSITETFIRPDGSTYEDVWYRVTDEAMPNYQALIDMGSQCCTESMLYSMNYILDHLYKVQDGKLYVWQNAGSDGGLMGVDYAYITSVEQDGWSLIVHMNAFGAKESWDMQEDFSEDFEVTLKPENGTLKVDLCGISERSYITCAYDPTYDIPVQ